MHRSLPIAIVTSFAFVWAVLWPDVARARDTKPPPAAAATPAPAPPDDASLKAAKQHFEAGRIAYAAADFPSAIREFKAAEALRPSPILAYNIGLSNEKLNRRRVAVRYYKRYLEDAPAAPNRAEVEGRITTLERDIAAQPQMQQPENPQDNPPPPPQQVAQPGDPNAPPPQATVQPGQDPYGQPIMTAPPPRKKRSLWWVWLIVGIGGAVVITGIVVGVVFAERAASPVIYDGKIASDRLQPSHTDLFERAVSPAQHGPEIAPVVQFHF